MEKHKLHGFTLIELLVVIVIIGILATISVSTFSGYFSKARDAIRLSDISNLHTALALYAVTNQAYPEWQGPDLRENSCFSGGGLSDSVGQWGAALQPLSDGGFINGLPNDPQNEGAIGGTATEFCYAYHRHSSLTSTYNSCVEKSTGAILFPGDYEYLLYFSLEDDSTYPYYLRWNDNSYRPSNACAPGPAR